MFRFLSWIHQFRGQVARDRRKEQLRSVRLGIQGLLLEDRLVPSSSVNQSVALPPELSLVHATTTHVADQNQGHGPGTLEHARGPEWGEHPQQTTGSSPTTGGSTPTTGGSTPTIGGRAFGSSQPVSSALSPAKLRNVYGIGAISFAGHVGVSADGAGQTIAIVDAYDDPDIAGDLQVFDSQFGLPNPPSFIKMNEYGSTSDLPGVDTADSKGNDWEIEESLDVEWAHAIAPGANIILIEANSSLPQDLAIADQTAENLPGVSVISNSFGGPETANEMSYDEDGTTPAGHPGVTILYSSGDHGSPDLEYPSVSPDAVAVGGTQLNFSKTGTLESETAWSGAAGGSSGGGVSKIEREPVFQEGVQTTGFRTSPDVSFDASPTSGVPIYDSYDYGGAGSWSPTAWGGTSLACPCWAGLIAIADQGRALNGEGPLNGATQTLPGLYSLPTSDFNLITSGSNGKYKANPEGAYSEVTGIGSPIANKLIPDLAAMNFMPDGQAGTAYSQTITLPSAIESVALSNPSYKVTLTSLDLSLSISGNELTVSGIPTKTGTLGLIVTMGGGVTQLESLTVNPGLTLTPSPLGLLPAAGLDTPYSQTITAVGGTGAVKVSTAVTSGVLGLSVKVRGSTVTVSGTPKKTGTLTFRVTAIDKYGLVSEGYSVTVGPTASLTALPEAALGSQYTQTISVTGGVGAVTTTTIVTSSTTPQDLGLTISATGFTVTISGTPTAAGTVNFNLVSTDSKKNTFVNYYTLTVTAAGLPTVTLDPVSTGIESKLVASFTAAASGPGPLSVQWQVSTEGGPFTNLSPGGVYGNTVTSPTLVIAGATTALNGNQYQAVFANASGSVNTSPATLIVDTPLTIKETKTGQIDKNGATLTPFSKVKVANAANPSELLAITITVSNPALGTLSNLGGGSYDSTTGQYVLTGVTAAQAQAALEAIQFVPEKVTKTTKAIFDLTIANASGVTVNDATTVNVEP